MLKYPLRNLKTIMLGAGGHAVSISNLMEENDQKIDFVVDPIFGKKGGSFWNAIAVMESDENLSNLDPKSVDLVIGFGHSHKNSKRRELYRHLQSLGFYFPSIISKNAYISETAQIGMGCQIMYRTYVGPNVIIKDDVIVNTGAIVEHDCFVNSHVHLAPASCLCGGVKVGEAAFIGAGSTVVPEMDVPKKFFLNAGNVLNRTTKLLEVP